MDGLIRVHTKNALKFYSAIQATVLLIALLVWLLDDRYPEVPGIPPPQIILLVETLL